MSYTIESEDLTHFVLGEVEIVWDKYYYEVKESKAA